MVNHKKAGLLTIPSELRNTIYEYALSHNERIDLNYMSNPPGLLRTCRLIRKEATDIYYQGNDFVFTVHDYDGVEAKHAFNLIQKYRPNDKRAVLIELCENCTTVHICKLHKWLKAYHADPKVPYLRQDKRAEETDEQTLARRTFGVVQAMRSKPWREVEEVLASFYRAIDVFQSGDSDEDSEDDSEDDDDEDWTDEDDEDESDVEDGSNQDDASSEEREADREGRPDEDTRPGHEGIF